MRAVDRNGSPPPSPERTPPAAAPPQEGKSMPRAQGNKRRSVIGAAVAACVLGATFVGIAITNAVSAPIAPQSYTDYVMFAEAGLHVGFETQITGNIGARLNRTKSPGADVALRMGGGGTVLVGNAYVG